MPRPVKGSRRQPKGRDNGGRVTRSSRAKLTGGLDDPQRTERELHAQLEAMGLYAANTTGDGNCLFRALSDQLYGYPHMHASLRQGVCDYLQAKPEKFAGFVDVEKSFDEYVGNMRQNGTYGGHLELSAFAHMKQKEIKIIQPGLVYIVSPCDDSEQPAATAEREKKEKQREAVQNATAPGSEKPPPSEREQRRLRRERKTSGAKAAGTALAGGASTAAGVSNAGASSSAPTSPAKGVSATAATLSTSAGAASSSAAAATGAAPSASAGSSNVPSLGDAATEGLTEAYGPLYIAYHNWEHYSSIRNIDGPHQGLPRIRETKMQSAPISNAEASRSAAVEDDSPVEGEKLLQQCAPGYTLPQLRYYLKAHGGWESALEAIQAHEIAMEASEREGASGKGKEEGEEEDEVKQALKDEAIVESKTAVLKLESEGHLGHRDAASELSSALSSPAPVGSPRFPWAVQPPSSVAGSVSSTSLKRDPAQMEPEMEDVRFDDLALGDGRAEDASSGVRTLRSGRVASSMRTRSGSRATLDAGRNGRETRRKVANKSRGEGAMEVDEGFETEDEAQEVSVKRGPGRPKGSGKRARAKERAARAAATRASRKTKKDEESIKAQEERDEGSGKKQPTVERKALLELKI